MTRDAELTIEKPIPAPRRQVFDAWLDPNALATFMRPPQSTISSKAETDPRVGGRFLIVMRVGSREIPHQGEYREIDRHQRLVFTWHSEYAPADSEVTLTFAEAGARQTLLTLVHRGLPSTARAAHLDGWTAILGNFTAHATTGL